MYNYVFYLPLGGEDQQGQQAKSNPSHKHGSEKPIMREIKDLQKEPGHSSLVRRNLHILFTIGHVKPEISNKIQSHDKYNF